MRVFDEKLSYGRVAESAIARFAMRRGYSVLPVYECSENRFKGPQFFTAEASLVAPDLLLFKPDGRVLFVEAKHKSGFTWHRKTQRFVTGIDLKNWKDYLQISRQTKVPLWLMFLHDGKPTLDLPSGTSETPSGLFGAESRTLEQFPNHTSDQWGRGGMIYWSRKQDGGPLIWLASYQDVIAQTGKHL